MVCHWSMTVPFRSAQSVKPARPSIVKIAIRYRNRLLSRCGVMPNESAG